MTNGRSSIGQINLWTVMCHCWCPAHPYIFWQATSQIFLAEFSFCQIKIHLSTENESHKGKMYVWCKISTEEIDWRRTHGGSLDEILHKARALSYSARAFTFPHVMTDKPHCVCSTHSKMFQNWNHVASTGNWVGGVQQLFCCFLLPF